MAPASSPSDLLRPLNATELIVADLQPREPILEPIIARKSLAMLYGPRGLGKTFVALGIAWAAAGESFLKWRASRPHRVLYVDVEMAAVDMKARLQLLGSAPPTLDFLIADLNRDPLPDLGHEDGQVALWQSWGKRPELLVLDNLSSLVGFRRNDPDSWNAV
jgi:AAA domain-containing protein